ncbi:MarR family winged helix-turn-helix transcriptional regulator [Nocardioides aurantiacus]|uniref:DNA-binding MarR family transcriptional regulator n=1 Tax=Nocardioides aurantiacus TaxID=86796 RepID=A0A3N2CRQ9_9ACTN|nr:DNA-binding MarR family transcriptional regulator [Nocardioides aurantiacus]
MSATTDPPPVRGLDELLCFDLYAASRAVTAFYRPLLDELGLTYPQYLVLVALPAEGAVAVKRIGHDLELDHGTLTPLLRRMEQAGLLTRRRSTADERRVEVALTPEGRRLRLRFDDVQCKVGEAVGLDDAEFRALQASLVRLTRAVRRAADTPADS